MTKLHLKIFLIAATFPFLIGCSPKSLCELALQPKMLAQTHEKTREMQETRYPGINAWYDSLYLNGTFRDTVITGEGSKKIHAIYAGEPSNKGTALIIHGYGVDSYAMIHFARVYRDSLGFNVILPDLQHHGQSEGDVVQMGWFDRLDAKRWVNVACDLWQNDFMVVHGVSMGAATTMMLSGEPDLPECVRAFVEDCGYSSVWDEFDYLRKKLLVSDRLMQRTSEYCEKTYGWNFKEASSVNQLAKCSKPMIFIHGEEDTFVPSKFAYKCYDAKTQGYKELWIVSNTPTHALSFHDHQADYMTHLKTFLEKARQEGDSK